MCFAVLLYWRGGLCGFREVAVIFALCVLGHNIIAGESNGDRRESAEWVDLRALFAVLWRMSSLCLSIGTFILMGCRVTMPSWSVSASEWAM